MAGPLPGQPALPRPPAHRLSALTDPARGAEAAEPPPRQLALPLPGRPSVARADVLADASNAEALAWLDRPAAWPGGRLALHGPPGSGKTHLLRAQAQERGWDWREGPTLRGWPDPPSGRGAAVDDADCAAEEAALLHLLNACAERGLPVLLAGRAPPARWRVALPDLASRLRTVPAVALGPPGDGLLRGLLAKLFADRQLRVAHPVQDWLLARLPRTPAAVAAAAARLDRAALAVGQPVSRALARVALADLLDPDGADGEDGEAAFRPGAVGEEPRDRAVTDALPPSPPPPRLL